MATFILLLLSSSKKRLKYACGLQRETVLQPLWATTIWTRCIPLVSKWLFDSKCSATKPKLVSRIVNASNNPLNYLVIEASSRSSFPFFLIFNFSYSEEKKNINKRTTKKPIRLRSCYTIIPQGEQLLTLPFFSHSHMRCPVQRELSFEVLLLSRKKFILVYLHRSIV